MVTIVGFVVQHIYALHRNHEDLRFLFQNSLYSVDALLKNHDRFEKLMEQQVEQVEDVRQFAGKLETQDHYAWDEIKERRQAVEDRYSRLHATSYARRTKLGDSNNYQLFLRNLYEVCVLIKIWYCFQI